MFAIRPDRSTGRPARVRAVFATAGLAALAAAAAACSDSAGLSKTTSCGNYPCTVASTATVGDTVLLNVRVPGGAALDNVGTGSGECDAPNLVKARIAATSQHAIIVVDTRNPTNGLTDAYYATIAQAFDTLVYPTDTRHFGTPLDIDKNGRVLAFYTRAVNGLTPANADSYVGGFFYSRDLFPTTSSAGFQGCAGSNAAEMFYLLAPDPTGAVNGNTRDTAFVRRVTVGTIAHEFQHLISAERRLYVLQTQNFDEEVWLNEGMSHIAEELNFYRSANLSPAGQPGQSPRARLTAAAIRNTLGAFNALNGFQFQNFARLSLYLAATEQYSPYSENDSLETRGATWSFLRYTLDRAGSTDSALTYPLVNSSDTGIVNLRAVVAARGGASGNLPLETWFRDWAVSSYADGLVPNLASQYTQPSWVFRNQLTAYTLSDNSMFNGGQYPLDTRTLANGSAQTVNLPGGGASYFRFSVPAAGTATLTTSAGSSALPSTSRLALVTVTGAGAGTVTTYDGTDGATITVPNTSAAAATYALVAFNGATVAATSQVFTVTGSGIAAPAANTSLASGSGAAYSVAGGPTVRALAAAREPVMSDAAVMRRLHDLSRTTLAPRAMGARALYQQARRSGDFSAWSRQRYMPGTVQGLVVPVGAGVPSAAAH